MSWKMAPSIRRKLGARPARISAREAALLLERIEMYVSSGMPLDRALAAAGEAAAGARKTALERIHGDLCGGSALHQSMSAHLKFSPVVASIISCGERAGSLPRSLAYARELMERADELRRSCLSAMVYPAAIGLCAAVLTVGLMRGVVPEITPMLEGLHADLPWITRLTIAASDALVDHGLVGGVAGAALFALIAVAYRRIRPVQHGLHTLFTAAPVVGGLVSSYALSTFLRSCGLLIESGMPAVRAYEEAVAVVGLAPLRRALVSRIEDVRHGTAIGEAVKGRRIPRHVSALIASGELSGALGSSMVRAASILDRDIGHALKRATALLEPVSMAAMGIIVGTVAVSIMLPIYDISKVLQK